MKVNILSPGRFHVCDLTRELAAEGIDVVFYSYVSKRRLQRFGLSSSNIVSLFFPLAPIAFLERKVSFGNRYVGQFRRWLQDRLTACLMRPADVTIAMSGEFNRSLSVAKRRGSLIICERGSKHIIDQKAILDANPFVAEKAIDEPNIRRELLSYRLADYIAVASQHVAMSFLNRGFKASRLFVNPYGVSLTSFHPVPDAVVKYDLIMVGTWGYQKGSDLLTEAIRKTHYTLLHVGAIGDMPFPEGDAQFCHIAPVDETELYRYYAMAKVFVLPSRQEGLAMVQAQAIACNLPLIGSVNSGAQDLQQMVKEPQYVSYIETYTPEALVAQMDAMMALYAEKGKQNYAGEAISELTWRAYGQRYAAFLKRMSLHDSKG